MQPNNIDNDENSVKDKMNSGSKQKEHGFVHIWYTNVDTPTKDKLLELNAEIKSQSPPDIIAMTVIKPKNHTRVLEHKQYNLGGYHFEEINLAVRGPSRGVALYVRNGLNYQIVKTLNIVGSNQEPTDEISVELKLKDKEKMIISNIYRSPNSTAQENNNINNFIRTVSKMKYDHHLILGDFNRKTINWDTVSSTSGDDCAFIEAVRDGFLTQHILSPTRGCGTNKPSLIDLVFSTDEQEIENIDITAPLGKSDHAMIKVLHRLNPDILPDKITCDYSKADYQKFVNKMDINWIDQLNVEGIDQMWINFVSKFNQAEEECVPRKIVKIGKKRFTYHHLDRKTLAKRKKKYRLWKRYLISKNKKIYEEYCRCRNQYRRLTRKAIKSHEKEIAKNTKCNNKVFWRYINSKIKSCPAIPELFTTSTSNMTKMTIDDKEKANILAKFFSSVYKKEPNWTWEMNKDEKPEINHDSYTHTPYTHHTHIIHTYTHTPCMIFV